jgi:hypothetical protein
MEARGVINAVQDDSGHPNAALAATIGLGFGASE